MSATSSDCNNTPDPATPDGTSSGDPIAGGTTGETIGGLTTATTALGQYQQTLCQIDAGNVTDVLLLQGNRAVITYQDGTRQEILYPADDGAGFVQRLTANDVLVTTVENRDSTTYATSSGGGIELSMTFWIVLSIIIGVFMYQRWRTNHRNAAITQQRTVEHETPGIENATAAADGRTRAGRSSTRTQPVEIPTTRFGDVAGCNEAVDDLRELVTVLSDTERYERLGARTPRGALLSGPPGTGKTLLARAVAGEAGVPFWACAGSDFVEKYVGVGARRIRDTFERARRHGRGIIFIDEIDAVGKSRGGDHANDERDNTLIALLNELDGFRGHGLIVIAATNRPDVLDDALLRPGRLDRRIHVGLPDIVGRRNILDIHCRSKPLADDVNLDEIARRTPGMSGAQLEQICNEAALEAARRQRDDIDHNCFGQAVELVAMGRARRSAIVTDADRRVTAWHEAGHTVAALCHDHADRPVSVSIIPRGEAGGVTWMEGADDHLLSRDKLRARLVVALAGRAAEELLMGGEHTAGASSDLAAATQLARAMVDRFGMTDRGLGVRYRENDDSSKKVDELLDRAHADAHALLGANRALLEAIVDQLLDHDDLDSRTLRELAAHHQHTIRQHSQQRSTTNVSSPNADTSAGTTRTRGGHTTVRHRHERWQALCRLGTHLLTRHWQRRNRHDSRRRPHAAEH